MLSKYILWIIDNYKICKSEDVFMAIIHSRFLFKTVLSTVLR